MNDNTSPGKSSPYPTLIRDDKNQYVESAARFADFSNHGPGDEIIRQKMQLRDSIVRDLQKRSLIGPAEIWTAFRERSAEVKNQEVLHSVAKLLFSAYAEQTAVRASYRADKAKQKIVGRKDRLEALRKSVFSQLIESEENFRNGDWKNVLLKGTQEASRKILNNIRKGVLHVPGEGNVLDGEEFILNNKELFPETEGFNSKKGVVDVFRKAFGQANALSNPAPEVERERIFSGGYTLIKNAFENDPEQTAFISAALGLMWGEQYLTQNDIRTAVKTVFDAEEERLKSNIRLIASERDNLVKQVASAPNERDKNKYIERYDDLSPKIGQELDKFQQFSREKTEKLNKMLIALIGIHEDPSLGNVQKIAQGLASSGKPAEREQPRQNITPSLESLPEEKRITLKQAFGRALNAGISPSLTPDKKQKLSSLLETGNAFFNLTPSPLVKTLRDNFNVDSGFNVENILNDFFGKPSDENQKIHAIARNALEAVNNVLHIG